MPRAPIVVGFAMVAGVSLVSARQTAPPRFRTDTHTVSIYATVLDNSGRLVPNLQQDDFEVYDNGVRQPIAIFANDLQPITIVIMLDRSGSMMGNFNLVRSAAEQFVANLLDDDRARLGSFSIGIRIEPSAFTSDRGELVRILREDLQAAGPTPLWAATSAAMSALDREPGRRVVLMFTDGYDNPDPTDAHVTFASVRDRAEAENIMVYGIGFTDSCGTVRAAPAGRERPVLLQRGGRGFPSPPSFPGGRTPGAPGPTWPPSPPVVIPHGPTPDPFGHDGRGSADRGGCESTKPDPELRELAASGGGGYFELHGTDDLGSTFARVADELHHQYLLAFTPATLDGTMHTLDVRLRDHGTMTVRARRTYVATPDR